MALTGSTLELTATSRPNRAGSLMNGVTLSLTIIAGFGGLWLISLTAPIIAIAIAALLFLIGIPHGGAMMRAGKAEPPHRTYNLVYVGMAASLIALWFWMPLLTLLAFLVLSAHHFGQSETHLRTAGLSVTLGSLTFWPDTTIAIFSVIMGMEPPSLASYQIALFSGLGAVALSCPLIESLLKVRDMRRAVALTAVMVLFHPVLAVGIYFLFFHAMPEYRRQTLGRAPGIGSALKLYGPVALPAFIGSIVFALLIGAGLIPLIWIGALGIAITIPHMVLPDIA